jgi:putative ABC transport system ATP-binding protein
VNEPDLLLADEPTGNLDHRSAMEIISIFQSLNRDGRTLVLVTHDQEIARHASRVVTLERGRIVADENVKEPKVALAQEAL